MKVNFGLSAGDEVKLKNDSYGCGKIYELLPVGYGGKSYKLAKVKWSTGYFYLIKVFALRDLIKRDKD